MSEQQFQGLPELLEFSPVRETICAGLSFEEANRLKIILNYEELDCPILVVDPVTHITGILPGVNPKTVFAYRQIQEYGVHYTINQAIKKRDKELIRMLLKFRGKNKSPYEYLPLIVARRKHDLEIMQFLLDLGEDINESDSEGTTPLLNAVWNIDKPSVKFLLEHGANPSLSDNYGPTPLMFAALRSSKSMTKELIKAGADVNAVTRYGETALIKAVRAGSAPVTKILLENGANPQIVTVSGETALSVARTSNKKDRFKIIELLES